MAGSTETRYRNQSRANGKIGEFLYSLNPSTYARKQGGFPRRHDFVAEFCGKLAPKKPFPFLEESSEQKSAEEGHAYNKAASSIYSRVHPDNWKTKDQGSGRVKRAAEAVVDPEDPELLTFLACLDRPSRDATIKPQLSSSILETPHSGLRA